MSINIIGITGPSGAGKSVLCTYLAKKGVPVIDADEVYHSLLVKNSPCTLALAKEFGEEILSPDGTPDRKKLGAIVFSSDEKLKRLNSIVLGFVIDKINEIIASLEMQGQKCVVLDAPTLIESGFSKECSSVLSVLSPKQDRVRRIVIRDGITEEAALLRINAQKSDEFYTENSHHVIINDSCAESLYEAFEKIYGTNLYTGACGGANE